MKKSHLLLICLLFICLSVAYSAKVGDSDAWWMLAGGRLVLDGPFPTTNTLSHTSTDYPWVFTQWLFAAGLALAERGAGLYGVEAVQVIVVAAICILLILTVRRAAPRLPWYMTAGLLLLAFEASRHRFIPRGDLATLLGLVLINYLWVERPKHLPLYFLVLSLLWTNMHVGVVFGLIWLSVLTIEDRLRPADGAGRIGAWSLAAFFVGHLGNPGFVYHYRYLLENVEILQQFPMGISELQPPVFSGFPCFYLSLGLAALLLPRALRQRRIGQALLLLLFGVLALKSRRFISYFVLATFPMTCLNLSEVIQAFKPLRGNAARVAMAVVFAAAALAGAAHRFVFAPELIRVGWGADYVPYPKGSCDFIEARGLSGKMFNEFGQGGFIAWRLYPRYKVFIDGRGSAYPRSFFGEAMTYRPEETKKVLDRYGVDFAIVQRRPFEGDIDLGRTFDSLGWPLVYIEGSAMVFVRPGSPDARKTEGDTFALIKPWLDPETLVAGARRDPAPARGELMRIDPRLLHGPNDFHVMGIAANIAGDPGLAEKFLAAGLLRHPLYVGMRVDYAQTLVSLGRKEEARSQYETVIRQDPESRVADIVRRRLESP
jgi:hypothetical protein